MAHPRHEALATRGSGTADEADPEDRGRRAEEAALRWGLGAVATMLVATVGVAVAFRAAGADASMHRAEHRRLRELAARTSLRDFAAALSARERAGVAAFRGSVREFWRVAQGTGELDEREFWRRDLQRALGRKGEP